MTVPMPESIDPELSPVRDAASRLIDLDSLALTEVAARFDALHAELQTALSTLDED